MTLYRSTRSEDGGAVTFREALFAGLAPDGGLYLPLEVPPLPAGWQDAGTFPQLASEVLAGWLPELDDGLLAELCADAFDFPVPLRQLSDDRFVIELFHGPTLAFKDFGARFMARVMDELLSRSGERLTVLVATSGDTGSAVAAGFSGRDNLDVVLLYPQGRVSAVQEQQLILERAGVTALAVAGTFDDCQRLVKSALLDQELAAAGVNLTTANSINIARLLPQQLYYLWALKLLEHQAGTSVAPLVSVPSGNLGNLTAGLLAAQSGANIGQFLAAHNENDYFPRFLAGEAKAFDFGATVPTLSNAMDVGAPSNFERLHALGVAGSGSVPVSGMRVSDEATLTRIARTWREDSYLACPHTAVALEAVSSWREQRQDRKPALILATAHPAKFPDTIAQALPEVTAHSEALAALAGQPVRMQRITPQLAELRALLQP